MPVNETRSQQSCVLLHRTSNKVCYNGTQLIGMLGTVVLDQQVV